MSKRVITLDVVCKPCGGTGLYVGLAERDGAAVVCFRCKGTGKDTVEYEPFDGRRAAPSSVTSVHVGRGYVISTRYAGSDGGLPIDVWKPGTAVPADEKLYCPFLYTNQAWCAKPVQADPLDESRAPLLAGQNISSCKHWDDKGGCWAIFHASAPEPVRVQVS